MAESNEIGNRIKDLREKNGLTQSELSQDLKRKLSFPIKRETIAQWENGTRDLKTIYTQKLAEYFDVSCDYIIRGVKAENIDIHLRTGFSDLAIENISTYKNQKSPVSSKILNQLLENIDFINLLTKMDWLKVDAVKKEHSKKYQNLSLNEYVAQYEIFLAGRPISLNDEDYYFFMENRIKEEYIVIVRGIIDDYLKSIDIDEVWHNQSDILNILK